MAASCGQMKCRVRQSEPLVTSSRKPLNELLNAGDENKKGWIQYSILCLLTFFDPYIVFFRLTFGKILFY